MRNELRAYKRQGKEFYELKKDNHELKKVNYNLNYNFRKWQVI
jgi:hypothetical protein